jgi:hypothetical protein
LGHTKAKTLGVVDALIGTSRRPSAPLRSSARQPWRRARQAIDEPASRRIVLEIDIGERDAFASSTANGSPLFPSTQPSIDALIE